jgi:hypothetical protein
MKGLINMETKQITLQIQTVNDHLINIQFNKQYTSNNEIMPRSVRFVLSWNYSLPERQNTATAIRMKYKLKSLYKKNISISVYTRVADS